MLDQYGMEIPLNDLSPLLVMDAMDLTSINKIMKADWYEATLPNDHTCLFVNAKQMGSCVQVEGEPSEIGIDLEQCKIMKIDSPLKRWEAKEDLDAIYFFHA